MAPVDGDVSDHVEIDDADAYLRVEDASEAIDNRGLVDQVLLLSGRDSHLGAWHAIYTLFLVSCENSVNGASLSCDIFLLEGFAR